MLKSKILSLLLSLVYTGRTLVPSACVWKSNDSAVDLMYKCISNTFINISYTVFTWEVRLELPKKINFFSQIFEVM